MSEVSSRPRVRSVASRAVEADAFGAVAVSTVVATALRGLAREVFTTPPSLECTRVDRLIAGPEVVSCLAQMRDRASASVAPGASRVTAEKAVALLAISEAPLVVRPASVTAHVQRLLEAPTVEAVQRAEVDLVRSIKSENSHLLGEALVASCRQASIDAGFVSVDTTVETRGVLRVVATDHVGRALVTEIRRGDDTLAPSVETEVVGVTDGRCHAILDRFDAAMEAQGVRTDGSPTRKWTGGVCELSLARDFIREKVAPAVSRMDSSRTVHGRPLRRRAKAEQRG